MTISTLFPRFSAFQIRVFHNAGTCKHTGHRGIHMVKIRFAFFRFFPRPLKLYGGNQLHGFCDLLCAGDTVSAPLNISHWKPWYHPPAFFSVIMLLYSAAENFALHSPIAWISFCSASSESTLVSLMLSGISGYLVLIYSNGCFFKLQELFLSEYQQMFFLVAAYRMIT